MGNTMTPRHGLQFKRMVREALPSRGAHAGSIFGVQLSDQKRAEMDRRPTMWRECFETESLTDESTSDEAQTTLPFDVAMRTHASLEPVFGIAQCGQSLRPGARRGAVSAARRFLAEGLVGTTMIVVVAPAVGAALLGMAMASRRSEHLGLVAAVQLLVRGVVARACPTCELDANPQAQPPEAEARKPQGTFAAKGRTVVHADRARQTVTAEEPGENPPHGVVALLWEQADLEEVTAFGFAHRERLLALAIGGAEPALEIDRPDLMPPSWHRQSGMRHEGPQRARRGRTPTSPSSRNQRAMVRTAGSRA